MGTHRTYCPVEAEPTCGKVRRTHGGAPLVLATGPRVAVRRVALHFVYETRCRWCWKQMLTTVGLGVVRPEAVVASKTAALKQVGLVVNDPFPFPWLFVILDVGALRPMRADAVMVAGRCMMMKHAGVHICVL
jgi:hypothetical protein